MDLLKIDINNLETNYEKLVSMYDEFNQNISGFSFDISLYAGLEGINLVTNVFGRAKTKLDKIEKEYTPMVKIYTEYKGDIENCELALSGNGNSVNNDSARSIINRIKQLEEERNINYGKEWEQFLEDYSDVVEEGVSEYVSQGANISQIMDSVNENNARVDELRKKIKSGNLSDEELINARQEIELFSIKNKDLLQRYGDVQKNDVNYSIWNDKYIDEYNRLLAKEDTTINDINKYLDDINKEANTLKGQIKSGQLSDTEMGLANKKITLIENINRSLGMNMAMFASNTVFSVSENNDAVITNLDENSSNVESKINYDEQLYNDRVNIQKEILNYERTLNSGYIPSSDRKKIEDNLLSLKNKLIETDKKIKEETEKLKNAINTNNYNKKYVTEYDRKNIDEANKKIEEYIANFASLGIASNGNGAKPLSAVEEFKKMGNDYNPYFDTITPEYINLDDPNDIAKYTDAEVAAYRMKTDQPVSNYEEIKVPDLHATNDWDLGKKVGATVAQTATNVVIGIEKGAEGFIDFFATAGTGIASLFTLGYDAIKGDVGKPNSLTCMLYKEKDKFVETEWIGNVEDSLYDSDFGKWMDDNSLYRHDGMVGGVVQGLGEVGFDIALGNAFAGALEGTSLGSSMKLTGTGTKVGSGMKMTGKALSTKTMSITAGVVGFGKGEERALQSGATTVDATKYAVLSGAWDALQWKVGSAIGEYSQSVIASQGISIFKKLGIITGTVALDSADAALEGFAQPALQSVYSDKSYGELFQENGGWDAVATQAWIGGIASAAGSAFDFRRARKGTTNTINDINSNNISSSQLDELASKKRRYSEKLTEFIESGEKDVVLDSELKTLQNEINSLEKTLKDAGVETPKADYDVDSILNEINSIDSKSVIFDKTLAEINDISSQKSLVSEIRQRVKDISDKTIEGITLSKDVVSSLPYLTLSKYVDAEIRPGTNVYNKIANEGLVHITNAEAASKIIESGQLNATKSAPWLHDHNKAYMFAGNPDFKQIASNVDSSNIITGVRIRPTDAQMSNLTYRYLSDNAVMHKGALKFEPGQAEIVYFKLENDVNGNTIVREINAEAASNYKPDLNAKNYNTGERIVDSIKSNVEIADNIKKIVHEQGLKNIIFDQISRPFRKNDINYSHKLKTDKMRMPKNTNVTLRDTDVDKFFESSRAQKSSDFLLSIVTKYMEDTLTNNNELTKKAMEEGLIHFTDIDSANKIIQSGEIRPTKNLPFLYDSNKAYMFAGAPTYAQVSVNLDYSPTVITGVKIKPTMEQLDNLKYRFMDDFAVSNKGKFKFDKGQAEIVYYGVSKGPDGNLVYKQISEFEAKIYSLTLSGQGIATKQIKKGGNLVTIVDGAKNFSDMLGFQSIYAKNAKIKLMTGADEVIDKVYSAFKELPENVRNRFERFNLTRKIDDLNTKIEIQEKVKNFDSKSLKALEDELGETIKKYKSNKLDFIANKYKYSKSDIKVIDTLISTMEEFYGIRKTKEIIDVFDDVKVYFTDKVDDSFVKKLDNELNDSRIINEGLDSYGAAFYKFSPVFDRKMNVVGENKAFVIPLDNNYAELFGVPVNVPYALHELNHAYAMRNPIYIQNGRNLYSKHGMIECNWEIIPIDKNHYKMETISQQGVGLEEGINEFLTQNALKKRYGNDIYDRLRNINYSPAKYGGVETEAGRLIDAVGFDEIRKYRFNEDNSIESIFNEQVLKSTIYKKYGNSEKTPWRNMLDIADVTHDIQKMAVGIIPEEVYIQISKFVTATNGYKELSGNMTLENFEKNILNFLGPEAFAEFAKSN